MRPVKTITQPSYMQIRFRAREDAEIQLFQTSSRLVVAASRIPKSVPSKKTKVSQLPADMIFILRATHAL
jgi:hypothetical protein